ncbi:MAG: ATP-binding protein [Candidatus Firestonebacteria bacterium]
MKISIFSKIFGGYLFIIIALSSLIILFSFSTLKNHDINSSTDNLKNLGTTLSLQVAPLLEKNEYQKLDALVKKLGNEIKTRITIINSDGVVLADSEHSPKSMENHKNRSEIIDAIENGFGKSIRYSNTLKKDMLYVALPVFIKDKKELLCVIRVSLFLSDIDMLFAELKTKILHISLVIMIFSILGAMFFSRSLSRPIQMLKVVSKKIASGNFNAKVILKSHDELKDLAESFNNMAEQMKEIFEKLSQQKEELNNIISSIQEGLLLIDKKGIVLLANDSFRKIYETQYVENKYYWEVLMVPKFNDLIKRVISSKTNLIEEITLNSRIFLCSVTFLHKKEELVVLFHDITDLKDIEKMKRDFVTNVSHELRTPLTAIKGFAETLEDEVDQKSRHYVDIIKVHTDRLITIVQDLLILSELEEKEAKLKLENLNIKELLNNVAKLFAKKIMEKKLELKVEISENISFLKADSFKLEQMFINLIDNAVKYTEKGEIKISVKQKDETVIFEIKDTGIGIPKEYLNRIFERFFVVDKSRSRKLGGTGLGLSIVKHIVQIHNGKIDVESTPEIGSKFTVILPINPL